jgi:hypothetical protein
VSIPHTPAAPFPEDFSLVLGGPLYQMYLRSRLVKPPADLVERRILAAIVLTWVPLLVLALVGGNAMGGVQVPFLADIDVHIRFLVALPLLIVAEILVHQRIRVTVRQFIDRGIITPENRARFEEIIASTMRLRNSTAIEITILVGSVTLGYFIWREAMTLHVGTWYVAAGPDGAERLTLAGWWYAFISLNIFRFVLFRWYFRLVLWYIFLWRVARLPLRLNPLHPDRAGGLGFLGNSVFAFMPLLLAHTAVLAGIIAGRIWHEGLKLPAFQIEIAGAVAVLMIMTLLPLTFFILPLARAKREASREYGLVAMHYVDEFREKWMRGRRPDGEPLVGSADFQSLADLAGAHDVLREMRAFPFGRQTIIQLAIAIALPYLPLTLTMIPFEELVTRLIGKLI